MDHGTLVALASDINANAVAHGFWDEDRDFGEMMALINAELSEALEEHRKSKPLEYKEAHSPFCSTAAWWASFGELTVTHEGIFKEDLHGSMWPIDPAKAPECDSVLCKPEGIAVELADAYIRGLDTLHSLGTIPHLADTEWVPPENFGRAIEEIHVEVGNAYLAHKRGHMHTVRISLLTALGMMENLARAVGCDDFEAVIRRKHAFNRTRPRKHERAY